MITDQWLQTRWLGKWIKEDDNIDQWLQTNDYRQDGRVSEYRRTITLTSAKAGPGQQEVMASLWIYSICGEIKYDNTLNIFYLWWNKIWQHSEYILFVVKWNMTTLWIYSICGEIKYDNTLNIFYLWWKRKCQHSEYILLAMKDIINNTNVF